MKRTPGNNISREDEILVAEYIDKISNIWLFYLLFYDHTVF